MLVKMVGEISGSRNGKNWPPRGGLIALPDDEAVHLVANGLVEEVASGAHSAVETRIVEPQVNAPEVEKVAAVTAPEVAVVRRPGRPRKQG